MQEFQQLTRATLNYTKHVLGIITLNLT